TYSLALWFQVGDLSQDLRTLIGKGAVSPTFAVLLLDGSLLWIEGDDPSPILSTEPNQIQVGQAHHLVVISDQRAGSSRIALYLDGQVVAEAADLSRVLDESDAALHIGAFNNALGFEGVLDDVQVYNRALTGDEVNDLLATPGRTLGETTPVDSDGDGLSDAEEVTTGTDPLRKDTDGDGLEDGAEIKTHGTNPTLADSDSDSFSDTFEIRQGTDPNDASSKPEASTVPGLYAYWRFEEGNGDIATDSSGNGRDGVIISPDDVWEDAPGRGTVYHSNSSSYVEFGEIIPVMDLDNGFTWSLWINSDETTNNNIVLGNRYATDGADFAPREFIKFTPSAFEWHVDGAGQNVDAEDFAIGEWVHHLVVKDGDALTYYQNGEVAAEGTISSAPANIQPLYVGGQNGVETWSGLIEEVALWDRALSEAEVGSVLQLGEAGQSLAGGGVISPPSDATNDLVATRSADGVALSWTEGETATVQFSTDLINWQAIAENLSEKSYTDTDAGRVSAEQGYYRLAR
ncbi:MAG: LamG-like jellyroll fold domain-containing protein, partial [Verrucomicrobiales bacterium]